VDVEALVALMTDDAWVRMPPYRSYRGTATAHRFFTATDAHRRGIAQMVPLRANGQLAWGEYVRVPVAGGLHFVGIVVIGTAGDRICGITHFETAIARYFGLPRMLN
jgi:hypothetical protein